MAADISHIIMEERTCACGCGKSWRSAKNSPMHYFSLKHKDLAQWLTDQDTYIRTGISGGKKECSRTTGKPIDFRKHNTFEKKRAFNPHQPWQLSKGRMNEN